MNWSMFDPTDIVESGFGAAGGTRRRLVHDRLVTLNTDVFSLTKITQFPWPIFVEQPAMAFWTDVIQKFFTYALRRIATCGKQQGGLLAGVPDFAGWVRAHVRPAYQLPVHNAIADDLALVHIERPKLAPTPTSWTVPQPCAFEQAIDDVVGIPLARIRALIDALNRTYDVLAFDAGSVLRDLPDDTVEPDSPCDDRPDIVKLLDELALQSELLYLPERQRTLWNDHKCHVWPEQPVRHFNAYRRRAGLTEA